MRRHWIESDAFDRSAFETLRLDSPSLQALIDSGTNLLPHFDGFVLDLFALLFKMNAVMHDPEGVVPSAGFYRAILEQLIRSPALEVIRAQTALDEGRAGLATVLLGGRLLELIRGERIITRGEMLDYWNLDQQEQEIEARQDEFASAEELIRRASTATRRQLEELSGRMGRELETAGRRLQQKAREIRGRIEEGAAAHADRVERQLVRTSDDLAQSAEDSGTWGQQLGGDGRSSPGRQIELGRQLATNPKLRRLSQMVGRMREQALALRRKMFERSSEETYEVELGSELSRLLPRELVALRHPLLHRDFARRYIEGELLAYSLRGVEAKGRGPMIVCLDVSSSMAGEKEIWSKAVVLTLLDIARRQRRRFRSICFSSADTPLQVLDLNRREQYQPDLQQIFALAEYFPGGGTDFQRPLSAALDCLGRSRFRRGDVVFITDGECRVDPRWLAEFQAEKKRLGFSVFSVLIDVGTSSVATLREFSDKVATVSQLTGEGAREIFVEV